MKAFRNVTGPAIPLGLPNIDTDVIIPAKYLKITTRAGLGKGAFESLRYHADGSPDSSSPFNQDPYQGAPILIAGDNFGCGSSREHAAWAMLEMGIQVVIAPSYSEIFAGNAFKNGILAIEQPQDMIDRLLEVAKTSPITVDLERQIITTEFQDRFEFSIDPHRKTCLLEGLDEIDVTLTHESAIFDHERSLQDRKPWI